MKQLLLIVSVLLLTGCVVSVNSGTGDGNSARYLQAPGTEDMNLPFSSAVRAGDTLYLSGQLGIVPGTSELAEGGIDRKRCRLCRIFLARLMTLIRQWMTSSSALSFWRT